MPSSENKPLPMQINIEVNNKLIPSNEGQTILDALKNNGIKIPTLCRLESFTPTGACRLCVVEVEGMEHLVPACSYPVEKDMKIHTHSQRVIEARKTITELLLSNHPDDCLYCERNGNCELQNLAAKLNIRERSISGRKSDAKLDLSSAGIVHDPAKCVLCGRCIRVCEDIIHVATLEFKGRGNKTSVCTAMDGGLNFSSCIQCGQCILFCPTGALHEKSQLDIIQEAMGNKKEITTLAFYVPSVLATLAEEFNLRPGKQIKGILNAALKKIGFDIVYDAAVGSDIHVMEQAAELQYRINQEENIPMLSSACPAWIKDMEQRNPELLPYLSSVKSPEQIMGAIIKRNLAENNGNDAKEPFTVAITSCPAKKFEAQRQEMTFQGNPDIDAVLTTRELIKLIKLYGIDIQVLEEEHADKPFHYASSAGKLQAISGGTAESIMRTLHKNLSGEDPRKLKINKLRGTREFKEMTYAINDLQLRIASLSPLNKIWHVLPDIFNGTSPYHFIEVMACPGGCINGGGQPFASDDKIRRNRTKTIYNIDDKSMLQMSHHNDSVMKFYEKHLGRPYGDKSKAMLHTNYSKRDILL